MDTSMSEFATAVRVHDWPRYIATQFAPEDKRAALLVLFAFNAEIDRITRIASDPLPGEIRLQWWREVLSGEREGEARGHPLAEALLGVIRTHNLPMAPFDRLLEAKAFGLYHDAFPDTVSFEAWCGETDGALLQMATLILDPLSAKVASDASGHGGITLAVSNILSDLPRTRSRGQCWIPGDILAACGMTRESFVAGNDSAAMTNAVQAFSELGQKHFHSFKLAAQRLPKTLRPVYLPVFAARHVLNSAAARPGEVATKGVSVSALRTFLSIARAAIT
jgi:15-cis-phytoene synthase